METCCRYTLESPQYMQHVFVGSLEKVNVLYTVELQWLEHLWDHRKLFEPWVV